MAADAGRHRYNGHVSIPEELRWLFWETAPEELDAEAHADYILPRILEHGCLAEVQWAMGRYGLERIHRFLREVGHPELSERTVGFWRAVFKAEDEAWAAPPTWRTSSGVPWGA